VRWDLIDLRKLFQRQGSEFIMTVNSVVESMSENLIYPAFPGVLSLNRMDFPRDTHTRKQQNIKYRPEKNLLYFQTGHLDNALSVFVPFIWSNTVRITQSAPYSLPIDVYFGNNKKTGFYKVTAWGNLAKIIYEHCKTGTELFITGRLDYYSYQDDKGETHHEVSIVMEQFDFGTNSQSNNSE